MLETLISLLIVVALILFILDYIGVLEIVSAFVGLTIGAIGLIGKLLVWLARRFSGANAAKPPAPDRLNPPIAESRDRGGRMRSAVFRRPRSD